MRFTPLLPLALAASTAQAKYHEVTVGKGGKLRFDPEVIKAEIGDTIRYTFFSKNHSVVESNFEDPCEPLKGGFFSGFVPAELQDDPARTAFTAINPPEKGNTLDAYKQDAKDSSTSTPADGLPVGGMRRVTVDVGTEDGKLGFNPSDIVEPKGTIVNFVFNPKNHSVVESSFDKPCQPLTDGFSSGHIPVASSPSNVNFEYTIEDNAPAWFYCGQPNGNHCQSGMVGAINAPAKGNTLEAFIAKAKSATPPSTIPDKAPLKGLLMINGSVIEAMSGNVLLANTPPSTTTSAASSPASTNSLPSYNPPFPPSARTHRNAGGGKPTHYSWPSALSPNATTFLYLHLRSEDVLLHLLWEGYSKLSTPSGGWHELYPRAIVDTIGTWAAQALVQRATIAEVLEHYKQPVPASCTYKLPMGNVDDFLRALGKLNTVQIGALIDISARVAAQDSFVVPILMTQVGAKSRAAGVVNMMQDHVAAAQPREVAVPVRLAWSFVMEEFVESCPEEVKIDGMPDKPWGGLTIAGKEEENGEVVSVKLAYDAGKTSEGQFVAWMGPYGTLEFTPVVLEGSDKMATVPDGFYGDVWIAVVDKSEIKLDELGDHMIAGPEMVWITEPGSD
ncbi:hypothetical protein N0V88_006890 [Collariella sp. IMI 366227]|nr:hypothetical protein N0V88_006890 [Collariella sp. IMI 366227]